MEQHPVPQNILEVEFKLFGAFTLRQFMKILIGCMVGLFIFVLPLPFYIKYPFMAVTILTGIGLAVIPNLGIWINGLLKALFISPRYVWVKESPSPEVLKKGPARKAMAPSPKVSQSKKARLSEISLEKLLAATDSQTAGIRKNSYYDELEPEEDDKKLANVMSQVFSGKKAETQLQPKTTQIPKAQDTQRVLQKRQKTPNDYIEQINQLKLELSGLVKDQQYKEREAEILGKINDLYQEMRFTANPNEVTNLPKPSTPGQIPVLTNEKGQRVNVIGQNVFGIVVDKKDQPVSEAVVKFKNTETKEEYTTKISHDGRFATDEKIPIGSYEVKVEHPSLKFHTYKIVVTAEKLPAYKLRER